MGLTRWIAAPLLLVVSLCAPARGQLLVESGDPPAPWRAKTAAATLPGPAKTEPPSTLVDLVTTDLKTAEIVPAPQPLQVEQQPFASPQGRPGMYGPAYQHPGGLLGQLFGRRPLANPWNHPTGSSWGYGMFASKPRRFFGLGGPLTHSSWMNRPYHFDWFFGAMFGGRLIPGGVKQGDEVFGGYRFGAEINHYWGWEARLGLAALPIVDSRTAAATRSNDIVLWDVNWTYYPWGDARWRPFFSTGLGFASFNFPDGMGANIKETLFGVPWGVGLKYQWKDWFVLRADLTDNWYFGGTHTATQHNVSLTFGVEARFGGSRRNYWPWNPSRYLW
ncbi:MAG: outer membrane beta-barrel protein [Planctomycetes bacterium]|nr:outer membrane beta-barrel protein [Planctomycetota bacterium]